MRIVGADVLARDLKRMAKWSDVKKAVKLNGSEMQESAQRKAPVDTGDLKRAITLELTDDGYTAIVTSGAEYAWYQEYGTRYQTGTPHIRPAFHEQEPLFISDIQRLIKDKLG